MAKKDDLGAQGQLVLLDTWEETSDTARDESNKVTLTGAGRTVNMVVYNSVFDARKGPRDTTTVTYAIDVDELINFVATRGRRL